MKAATLADVAARLGLSSRTVSRVVRNEPGISEATRQRVAAMIAELGYRPNMAARSLVTKRSTLIGLIVPDLGNPYFPSLAVGVQLACRERGENLILGQTRLDAAEQKALIESLVSHGVDGLIMFPEPNTVDQLIDACQSGLAMVVVNAPAPDPRIGCILSHFRNGVLQAVDHLVKMGHTNVAMLANAEEPQGLREQGFVDGLTANGLRATTIVHAIQPTVAEGHRAALELFEQAPGTTAVFAYNDLLAIGVMRACFELGRKVPDDCAVVGFDDIDLAAELTPALSTVRVDRIEVGRAAVRLLGQMIAGEEGPMVVELDAHLVVRESSGRRAPDGS
jgi:LacI family transcriptional regulator